MGENEEREEGKSRERGRKEEKQGRKRRGDKMRGIKRRMREGVERERTRTGDRG